MVCAESQGFLPDKKNTCHSALLISDESNIQQTDSVRAGISFIVVRMLT
jgi:hypothetical protein